MTLPEVLSVVYYSQLEIALGMRAGRAAFGSLGTLVNVSAVAAYPDDLLALCKNAAAAHIVKQLEVALLVLFSIAPTLRKSCAISAKPSASASSAIRAYISVHSSFSPAAARTRFSSVEGIAPPQRSLNHSLACSFSFAAVSSKSPLSADSRPSLPSTQNRCICCVPCSRLRMLP